MNLKMIKGIIVLFLMGNIYSFASTFIQNGKVLGSTEVPQVQSLRYGWYNNHSTCSGTLIGPKVVLTAGHCKLNRSDSLYFVIEDEKQWIKVVKKIRHPDYIFDFENQIFRNDLMVVILEREVEGIFPMSVTEEMPVNHKFVDFVGLGTPQNGVRQIGRSRVTEVDTYSVKTNSRRNTKQVALSGDSGGAGLLKIKNGEVKLFGVISNSTGMVGGFKTTFSRVFNGNSEEPFLRMIVNTYNVDICGINTLCSKIFYND